MLQLSDASFSVPKKPYAPIIRQCCNHHHLRKENNNSRCTTVNDNYHKNSYQKVPFVSPTNRANSQSSSFVVGRKTAAKNPFPQSLAARKYVRLTDTKFNNNKFKTKVEVIVGDTKGGSFDNRKEDDIKVKSKSSNSKVNIKCNNSGKITVDKNHSYLERSRIPFKAIENKMNSYKPKNSMYQDLAVYNKMELTNPDLKLTSESNLNNTLKVIRRNDSQDSK